MENSKVPHQAFRYLKSLIFLFMALCLFLSLAENILEKERLSFDSPIQIFLHGYATPLSGDIAFYFAPLLIRGQFQACQTTPTRSAISTAPRNL